MLWILLLLQSNFCIFVKNCLLDLWELVFINCFQRYLFRIVLVISVGVLWTAILFLFLLFFLFCILKNLQSFLNILFELLSEQVFRIYNRFQCFFPLIQFNRALFRGRSLIDLNQMRLFIFFWFSALFPYEFVHLFIGCVNPWYYIGLYWMFYWFAKFSKPIIPRCVVRRVIKLVIRIYICQSIVIVMAGPHAVTTKPVIE